MAWSDETIEYIIFEASSGDFHILNNQ